MARHDRDSSASLLERWVRDADIDLTTPPMLGEERNGTR